MTPVYDSRIERSHNFQTTCLWQLEGFPKDRIQFSGRYRRIGK